MTKDIDWKQGRRIIKLACTISGLMITLFSSGQTNFSGIIDHNAQWHKEDSPFLITGDVILNPNVTLTIDPGVEIYFAGSYSFEIRGILNAVGIPNDSIIFTSAQAVPHKQDWVGIRLSNSKGAAANFEYCRFSYADVANNVECCWDAYSEYFKRCSFISNNIAMMGYYGNKINVDNCEFLHNTIGITDGDKIIRNSRFVDNDYGLYNSSGSDAYYSTFTGNRVAYHGMRGVINNCVISENDTGVAPYFTNPDIIHSIISNNRIGVQIQGLYENTPGVIQESKICDNELYNIQLLDGSDMDLTTDCWCLTDSVLIAEKIFDGNDDISLGIARFSLKGADCADFVLTGSREIEAYGMEIKIYPNPVSSGLNIVCTNCISDQEKSAMMIIYNANGQCVTEQSISFVTNMIFDLSFLKSGIYFMNIIIDGYPTRNVIIKI